MFNLGQLPILQKGIKSKRISSFDRSGGNDDNCVIPPGTTLTIADIQCRGIIKHIWMTHSQDPNDPMRRRNLVLRMYWDNEAIPSVESPLGDFFGQGFGEYYNYASALTSAAPQDGAALVSYIPMPFETRALINITNEGCRAVTLYFYVDYEEHPVAFTSPMGRFHAFWHRELTKSPWSIGENEWGVLSRTPLKNQDDKENYLLADIVGKGQFLGVHYFCDSPTPMWYGEGDDMFRIDGEAYPFSLHGTGTEDFFNGAWCPSQFYIHPYFGYARIPDQKFGWIGRTHCYRYFIQDPIYFEKSLYASIEHGHANCLSNDISSVAYWYQNEPHKPFLALPSVSERAPRSPISCSDILRWRDSWKREMYQTGLSDPLWGNEQPCSQE